MAGIIDFGARQQTGPSSYGNPQGRAPYPGMIWDPSQRKWVWPNEAKIETALPTQNVEAALEALRRTSGQ